MLTYVNLQLLNKFLFQRDYDMNHIKNALNWIILELS